MNQIEDQISIFDLPEITEQDPYKQMLIKALRRGSGYENGKMRIYAAAILMDKDKLADFLQEEYGTGGNTIEGGMMDYSFRGVVIRKWDDRTEKHFAWNKVRDEIRKLIAENQYLTEKEFQVFQEIVAENDGEIPRPMARMVYPYRKGA